jgi:hypothetical protein
LAGTVDGKFVTAVVLVVQIDDGGVTVGHRKRNLLVDVWGRRIDAIDEFGYDRPIGRSGIEACRWC